METKQAANHRLIATTVPSFQRSDKRIEEEDSITLLTVCANDLSNSEAWQEFISRFLGTIRYCVARVVESERSKSGSLHSLSFRTNREDQEDLVQKILLRLVANDCLLLKKFKGETEQELNQYLSIISTSVVLDHYRALRSKRRGQRCTSLDGLHPVIFEQCLTSREDSNLERSVLAREIIKIAEAILEEEAQTPERYLLILKLHLFDGLSLSEISQYDGINITKEGVDKALKRIIGLLKQKLNVPRAENG